MDQKLIEKTVARTSVIYRTNKNFHVAMKQAVDEAGLPSEESDELLCAVAKVCAKKSAANRAYKKNLREIDEEMHKQRLEEDMAERAREANEHTHPIDE